MSISTCVWKQYVGYICKNTSSSSALMCGQGLLVICLVGPHVLQHLLTCNHYQDFLLHDLQNLLEGVPLAVRA
jgi:hypothetical protein